MGKEGKDVPIARKSRRIQQACDWSKPEKLRLTCSAPNNMQTFDPSTDFDDDNDKPTRNRRPNRQWHKRNMLIGRAYTLFEHTSLQPTFGPVFRAFPFVQFVSVELATAIPKNKVINK